MRPAILVLVIGLAALTGPLLLLSGSPHGIHITPDSFTYVGAAHNLAHGLGWTYPFGQPGAPVTDFPPLFPLLLSGGYVLGLNELTWALWQSAVLFWMLLLVVGLGTYRSAARSMPVTLAGMMLALLGVPPLLAYSSLLSESLFYPVEVLALFLLGAFLQARRTPVLVLAGAATSMCLLTRYAGVSLFLTGCLLLGVWPGLRLVHRFRALGVYMATSLALSLVWAIRNLVRGSTLAGSEHVGRDLTRSQVTGGLRVVSAWFFRPGFPGTFGLEIVVIVSLVVLVSVSLLAGFARDTRKRIEVPAIAVVLLVFPVVHFLFLIAANAVSSRTPPFNDRMLGPAYFPLSIGLLVLGHAVWRGSTPGRIPIRIALGSGVLALLVVMGEGARSYLDSDVSRYKQSAEQLSALTAQLRPPISARSQDLIYGNTAYATWFATGAPVIALPEPCRGHDRIPTPSYEKDLAALGRRLVGVPRTVVIFTATRSAGFGARSCPNFSLPQLQSVLQVVKSAEYPGVLILSGDQ